MCEMDKSLQRLLNLLAESFPGEPGEKWQFTTYSYQF